MKIFIYSVRNVEKAFLTDFLRDTNHECNFSQELLSASTLKLCAGAHMICVSIQDKVDKSMIRSLCKLGIKNVITRSAGYDHLEIEAAKSFGINIYNIPDYSPNAIAEHAIMLLLALSRKLNVALRLNNNNDFRLDQLMGNNLQRKSIGIMGLGKIGKTVAKILLGFDSKISVYDPYIQESSFPDFTFQDFNTFIQDKFALILCCPLNTSTSNIINKKAFDKMSSDTLIINVARGAIINSDHLIEALKMKKIAGAGLDVLENENQVFFMQHKGSKIAHPHFEVLNAFDNVIITPHLAGITKDSLESRAQSIRKTILNISNNNKCENKLV